MPRLYRPHIPLDVRCRVAMRQLGELWPDEALEAHDGALGAFLVQLLKKLTELLGEETLHLDHDPPLAARLVMTRSTINMLNEGLATVYIPDANDPDYLIYRGAQAHKIKTNVRGEHGQHPDRVLIKRERKRLRKPRRKAKIRSANRWPPKGSRKITRRMP